MWPGNLDQKCDIPLQASSLANAQWAPPKCLVRSGPGFLHRNSSRGRTCPTLHLSWWPTGWSWWRVTRLQVHPWPYLKCWKPWWRVPADLWLNRRCRSLWENPYSMGWGYHRFPLQGQGSPFSEEAIKASNCYTLPWLNYKYWNMLDIRFGKYSCLKGLTSDLSVRQLSDNGLNRSPSTSITWKHYQIYIIKKGD